MAEHDTNTHDGLENSNGKQLPTKNKLLKN
jgi:hypothetical protein